eukprot:6783663-Pyramimonas_sp.AAC.1
MNTSGPARSPRGCRRGASGRPRRARSRTSPCAPRIPAASATDRSWSPRLSRLPGRRPDPEGPRRCARSAPRHP